MAIKHFEVAAQLTVDQYKEQLVTNGWTRIGSGMGGAVFQHPTKPNVVVKVVSSASNASDMKWVQWCQKTRNPYAVRVHKVKQLNVQPELGQPSFAIYMEKLTPATKEQISNVLQYAGAAGRNGSPVLYPKGTHWRFVPGFNGDMFNVSDKNLAEVLSVIYSLTRRHEGVTHGITDMKPDNFLMRGTQLVFVDPIA